MTYTAKEIADALNVAAAAAKVWHTDVDADADAPAITLDWDVVLDAVWHRIEIVDGRWTYECDADALDGILTVVYANDYAEAIQSWAPGDVEWAQYDSEAGTFEWDWPGPGARDADDYADDVQPSEVEWDDIADVDWYPIGYDGLTAKYVSLHYAGVLVVQYVDVDALAATWAPGAVASAAYISRSGNRRDWAYPNGYQR